MAESSPHGKPSKCNFKARRAANVDTLVPVKVLESKRRQAIKQSAECEGSFEAGERSSNAEMNSVPECDMPIVYAAQVQAIRLGKLCGIPVR
jgi:hypothetical protein